MPPMLTGTVQRITFHNPGNGYTIARLACEGEAGTVTIVGSLAEPREGETIRVEGEWAEHPKYGRQFEFTGCTAAYPSTLDGIERYLGSGLVKGIGPVSARRIVEYFGAETLDVIDSAPERLQEVPGLGRTRVQLITRAWAEQRRVKDVMVFLQSHGITTGYATRIYKRYGTDAIRLIQDDPYRLERDIGGIGFTTADRLARRLGIGVQAPARIEAGLRHLLGRSSEEGHMFLPRDVLLSQARQVLEVSEGVVEQALERLCAGGEVIAEPAPDRRAAGAGQPERYYLSSLHQAEVGVAASLRRLQYAPGTAPLADVSGARGSAAGYPLADRAPGRDQRQAVQLAASSKVMVLTGGPGTGKTTVARQILTLYREAGLRVALCSPTGRAAKRLSEATAYPAGTIHRLLEFAPAEGRFMRGPGNALETDAVIVDEASMIDIRLMDSLLAALPDAARLVMVGDVDQLPSVGPGNVLGDIIGSNTVPVARLTEIFRQKRQSRIVLNAHRINAGEMPLIDNRKVDDFFFMTEDDPERVATIVEDLCARRLPAHGGYDPRVDIQVLVPMYKGVTGAVQLNQRLQQRLNPDGQPIQLSRGLLRVGDRVMQIKNNYDKGVFNGDMGVVSDWDSDRETARVRFESEVEYQGVELEEITLAYAISTHRAQGSEFPAVVLPLTMQHYVMLQRNLLYTAVTRARRLIVMVGSRKALALAVKRNQVGRRYTLLAQRLKRDLADCAGC